MAYRFFTIPIQDSGEASRELNAFLSTHKVLSVDRRWVDQGPASFWSLCIDYLDRPAGQSGNGQYGSRQKIDYREALSPEQFAIFAKLRDVRKEIAQAEAVPVYTIFTNEQLAQMVIAKATTKAALEKVEGVGDARVSKYGGRMLDVLAGAWPKGDETNGKAGAVSGNRRQL